MIVCVCVICSDCRQHYTTSRRLCHCWAVWSSIWRDVQLELRTSCRRRYFRQCVC